MNKSNQSSDVHHLNAYVFAQRMYECIAYVKIFTLYGIRVHYKFSQETIALKYQQFHAISANFCIYPFLIRLKFPKTSILMRK